MNSKSKALEKSKDSYPGKLVLPAFHKVLKGLRKDGASEHSINNERRMHNEGIKGSKEHKALEARKSEYRAYQQSLRGKH